MLITGVLILSIFAGASRELTEALIVNPYNTEELGESSYRAVTMSDLEQRERMRLMRTVVRHNNVYRWAGKMLLDAASVRKRKRIVEIADTQITATGEWRLDGMSLQGRPRRC
jgi:trehalose-6-phosphate synthase